MVLSNTGVQLLGGPDNCHGLVQLQTESGLSQACGANAGANEAKVICRQLGCSTSNARRVDSTE